MWKLEVNLGKSKVVHNRPGPKNPQTDFMFKCAGNNVDICHSYKYLGLILNEFLHYNVICKVTVSK